MLFGHVVRMDESADARRILTAVPQSEAVARITYTVLVET